MICLVFGGSGSGKSGYAEELVLALGERKRYYLATMIASDEEGDRRVARHRSMREPKHFETIEKYTRVAEASAEEGSVILLECVSNLVANEMFSPEGRGMDCHDAVVQDVASLAAAHDLVVVTNDVFEDLPPEGAGSRKYISELGQVNRSLAEMADHVTEVVYGLPVHWK